MSGDVNYSLICAVRDGDSATAERLISTYGLSYAAGWSDGYVLLCEALENGRRDMAMQLLNSGARVNNKSHNPTTTPLHLAAEKDYTDIVANLLDRQAAVDRTDGCGRTPLYCSVASGRLETVRLLLNGGAYVDGSLTNGFTPLRCAVNRNNLAIAEELLHRGASVNVSCSTYRGISESLLHVASRNKNSPMVELLLRMGAEVNAFGNGKTPLHVALSSGSDGVVELLVEKGADVNATGPDDEKPLHIAAGKAPPGLVKMLLERGADVDARKKNGATALCVAAQRANVSVIEEILRFRPDMKNEGNRGSLSVAIKARASEESRKILDLLLHHGFNVCAEDAEDTELLHAAAERGYLAVVESLLNLGADANAPLSSRKGATPLHTAILQRQIDVAELLLSRGANANAEDGTGKSAIFHAVERSVASIVELLLRSGASSKVTGTLLFTAAEKVNPEIVEMLLRSAPHLDVDATDKFGETALHCLAMTSPFESLLGDEIEKESARSVAHAKIAEMLLKRGASARAVTKNGETALHLAARKGNADLVKVLLENKAPVDCLTPEGQTPLHIAASENKITVVKMLLDIGANVNARTHDASETALHIASALNHAELVKLLLDRGADPDSENLQKRSPLCHAIICGNSDAVRVLLRHSSDDTLTCDNLMKLLFLAERKRDEDKPRYSGYDDSDSENDAYDDFHSNVTFSRWMPIVKILENYVIAMTALHTDKKIGELAFNYEEDCFYKRCQREIKKMRNKSIGGSKVTFYDILAKDATQLAAYARNESIAQALASEIISDEFPVYCEMIARRFEQGQKRDRLLRSGSKSLNALSGCVLPDLSANQVLIYLSNNDLEKLIEACPISDDCSD